MHDVFHLHDIHPVGTPPTRMCRQRSSTRGHTAGNGSLKLQVSAITTENYNYYSKLVIF